MAHYRVMEPQKPSGATGVLLCDSLTQGSGSGYLTLAENLRDQYDDAAKFKKTIPRIWAKTKWSKAVELTGITVVKVSRDGPRKQVDVELKWKSLEVIGGILGQMILRGGAVMGIDDMWKNKTTE